MINKHNVILAFVVSVALNYLGWDYIVYPARQERLAREFQVKAEAKLPPRARVKLRAKRRQQNIHLLRPKTLLVLEWTYKLLILGIAPGGFLVLLLRRRTYERLPNGKSVTIGTSLGLANYYLELYGTTPGLACYLVALVQLLRADAAAFPDAGSKSYPLLAWTWLEAKFPRGAKHDDYDHEHEDEPEVPHDPKLSRPLSGTKKFQRIKRQVRIKEDQEDTKNQHEAS